MSISNNFTWLSTIIHALHVLLGDVMMSFFLILGVSYHVLLGDVMMSFFLILGVSYHVPLSNFKKPPMC